ncbi:MAG: LamG-like jellyroll fold domain-containing protein [Verrucomicrobiia bacterium]
MVLPITCLISSGAGVLSGEALSGAAQPAPATPVERRTIPPLPVDLPVTNGLIRWWPNLFDVRDEITGQEGVVMGLLPPVAPGAEDETEFGAKTAWVQLQPAIPNEVFTLCFWVSCREDRPHILARLLAQETRETQWIFQTVGGAFDCFIAGDHLTQTEPIEKVTLGYNWRHVAISRETGGTSTIWLDGTRALEGKKPHPWPTEARWLVVGNGLRAGTVFEGKIRDLCAFDRVLTDEEVRAFYSAGVPRRRALNTSARLAATLHSVAIRASTNVVMVPRGHWIHDRFTTENGLPGNIVKAVVQSRDGYLWVGTEDGLARFDGRRFTPFTSENTPALTDVGQSV